MVETQLCKLRGTSDIYTNYRSPVYCFRNRVELIPKLVVGTPARAAVEETNPDGSTSG